jgi:hypothetical protein
VFRKASGGAITIGVSLCDIHRHARYRADASPVPTELASTIGSRVNPDRAQNEKGRW